MKVVDATPEEDRVMSERALEILTAFRNGGLGPAATAMHLIAALRVLHQAAPTGYRLELEAYLAMNLEEMRKAHQ